MTPEAVQIRCKDRQSLYHIANDKAPVPLQVLDSPVVTCCQVNKCIKRWLSQARTADHPSNQSFEQRGYLLATKQANVGLALEHAFTDG